MEAQREHPCTYSQAAKAAANTPAALKVNGKPLGDNTYTVVEALDYVATTYRNSYFIQSVFSDVGIHPELTVSAMLAQVTLVLALNEEGRPEHNLNINTNRMDLVEKNLYLLLCIKEFIKEEENKGENKNEERINELIKLEEAHLEIIYYLTKNHGTNEQKNTLAALKSTIERLEKETKERHNEIKLKLRGKKESWAEWRKKYLDQLVEYIWTWFLMNYAFWTADWTLGLASDPHRDTELFDDAGNLEPAVLALAILVLSVPLQLYLIPKAIKYWYRKRHGKINHEMTDYQTKEIAKHLEYLSIANNMEELKNYIFTWKESLPESLYATKQNSKFSRYVITGLIFTAIIAFTFLGSNPLGWAVLTSIGVIAGIYCATWAIKSLSEKLFTEKKDVKNTKLASLLLLTTAATCLCYFLLSNPVGWMILGGGLFISLVYWLWKKGSISKAISFMANTFKDKPLLKASSPYLIGILFGVIAFFLASNPVGWTILALNLLMLLVTVTLYFCKNKIKELSETPEENTLTLRALTFFTNFCLFFCVFIFIPYAFTMAFFLLPVTLPLTTFYIITGIISAFATLYGLYIAYREDNKSVKKSKDIIEARKLNAVFEFDDNDELSLDNYYKDKSDKFQKLVYTTLGIGNTFGLSARIGFNTVPWMPGTFASASWIDAITPFGVVGIFVAMFAIFTYVKTKQFFCQKQDINLDKTEVSRNWKIFLRAKECLAHSSISQSITIKQTSKKSGDTTEPETNITYTENQLKKQLHLSAIELLTNENASREDIINELNEFKEGYSMRDFISFCLNNDKLETVINAIATTKNNEALKVWITHLPDNIANGGANHRKQLIDQLKNNPSKEFIKFVAKNVNDDTVFKGNEIAEIVQAIVTKNPTALKAVLTPLPVPEADGEAGEANPRKQLIDQLKANPSEEFINFVAQNAGEDNVFKGNEITEIVHSIAGDQGKLQNFAAQIAENPAALKAVLTQLPEGDAAGEAGEANPREQLINELKTNPSEEFITFIAQNAGEDNVFKDKELAIFLLEDVISPDQLSNPEAKRAAIANLRTLQTSLTNGAETLSEGQQQKIDGLIGDLTPVQGCHNTNRVTRSYSLFCGCFSSYSQQGPDGLGGYFPVLTTPTTT